MDFVQIGWAWSSGLMLLHEVEGWDVVSAHGSGESESVADTFISL